MTRKPYASDVTDDDWGFVAPYLTLMKEDAPQRGHDLREVFNAVRWTEFVRSEAERRGFAWSYWEFASGFGIYDPEAKVWREDLLKALIP